MEPIEHVKIEGYKTNTGASFTVDLSYQVFGQPLHSAPIVLINHALTGNSSVSGKNGWWNDLIGPGKCIDSNYFTILAFNVPGNGFGKPNTSIATNYKEFVARDIANIFILGLKKLNIDSLFAIIGGSVGGGIAWEMAALEPQLSEHLIPIATDWKATDWLVSNCYIQDLILNHSKDPIADARIHAMTLYRTPESLTYKFNRTRTSSSSNEFNVESWLYHHGDKLEQRFSTTAYKLMNQILKTIDITSNRGEFIEVASRIESNIHIVTINSDLFFKPEENWTTYVDLKSVKENVWIHEIKSIHGHDAFLIEYNQLQRFLSPIFKGHNQKEIPLIQVQKSA